LNFQRGFFGGDVVGDFGEGVVWGIFCFFLAFLNLNANILE